MPERKQKHLKTQNAELERLVRQRTRHLESRIRSLEVQLEAARKLNPNAPLFNPEDALRRMSRVFETVAAPIIISDLDGKIVSINPDTTRAYAWDPEKTIGHSIKLFVPEEQHATVDQYLAEYPHGEAVRNIEGRIVDKLGIERLVLSTMSRLTDENGKTCGIVTIAKDLTDLKDNEKLLAEVNQELKQLILKDALTGLANRRHLDQRLTEEMARSARNGTHLSLLMIDIDYFKNYNDALGHPTGDECLKMVSQAIANCGRRPADFVARYGGEEFVMLLPDTTRDGAAWIAAHVRARIEALELSHPDSLVSDRVTASLGVATAKISHGLQGRSLLEAADKALYLAKQNGRNRVRAAYLPDRQDPGAAPSMDTGPS